jgi:GDPmannose 4,6-dehydratase
MEKQKSAVVFGAAGQDGSYLIEYLLSLGYKVFGMIRRNSTPEHQENRIAHLADRIITVYGDVTDFGSVFDLLTLANPDEIYNLAAMSHVRISFDVQQFTTQTNSIGVLNILECIKRVCPKAKFLQASSSEMFGSSVDEDLYQRETTPMHPVSPYGCSKLYAYHISRTYRRSYGMKIYNSICFNHESPRRGSNFVTNKVVKGLVRVKLGLQDVVELGNLDSYRDWGHSKDYVKAMVLIMQQPIADDYVVSTGVTNSVRDMVMFVCEKLALDFKKVITTNDIHKRPQELDYLKGDATKLKSIGWVPEYTFETLMQEMIEHWMKYYNKLTKRYVIKSDDLKTVLKRADRNK